MSTFYTTEHRVGHEGRTHGASYQVRDMPKKEMGKDDFLRLLVTELQNQDVLNTDGNKEFIAQIAQFSALEQMQNVAKGLTGMASAQFLTQSGALLGKEVYGKPMDNPSEYITGLVKEVFFEGDKVVLTVGDRKMKMEDVLRVREPSDGESGE